MLSGAGTGGGQCVVGEKVGSVGGGVWNGGRFDLGRGRDQWSRLLLYPTPLLSQPVLHGAARTCTCYLAGIGPSSPSLGCYLA